VSDAQEDRDEKTHAVQEDVDNRRLKDVPKWDPVHETEECLERRLDERRLLRLREDLLAKLGMSKWEMKSVMQLATFWWRSQKWSSGRCGVLFRRVRWSASSSALAAYRTILWALGSQSSQMNDIHEMASWARSR
jgi:hypothetical protein